MRETNGELAMKKRLIVAITGATGAVYGIGILKQLRTIGGWECEQGSTGGIARVRAGLDGCGALLRKAVRRFRRRGYQG